jgi:hypothetical protein
MSWGLAGCDDHSEFGPKDCTTQQICCCIVDLKPPSAKIETGIPAALQLRCLCYKCGVQNFPNVAKEDCCTGYTCKWPRLHHIVFRATVNELVWCADSVIAWVAGGFTGCLYTNFGLKDWLKWQWLCLRVEI